MNAEPTPKKKAWPLSLNSTEIREIEGLMAKRRATDRTEFVLNAVRQTADIHPSQAGLLANLAAIYHPAIRDELAEAVTAHRANHPKLNEAHIVMHFLEALTKALSDPGFKGSSPFELLDAQRAAEWEAVSESRIEYLAQRIYELQKHPPSKLTQIEADEAARRADAAKHARPKKPGA